jgi:hypothetical protein
MEEKLILKRASASRPSGEWNDDDYDVLSDAKVVGRIFKSAASPVGTPWMWTLAYGYHEVSLAHVWLRSRSRSGHEGVRKKLASRMSGVRARLVQRVRDRLG